MEGKYSQKKTWLSLAGWLAAAVVAMLVVRFSAGSLEVEEVNIVDPAQVITYPVPAAEEAPPFTSETAPMPPAPATDLNEGIEEAQGERAPDFAA